MTEGNKDNSDLILEKWDLSLKTKKRKIKSQVKKLKKDIKFYIGTAWFLVVFGLIILLFSTVYYFRIQSLNKPNNKFNLNELGDFLSGSVAAIWSLAGLLFVYVAFLGQKQQLLQQQLEILYNQYELKQNRLELKNQRLEMTLQNDTLKIQKFENTFFQMLSLFHSIVNSMEIQNSMDDFINKGRESFHYLAIELDRILEYNLMYRKRRENKNELDIVISTYEDFYLSHKNHLSHYFRTYYHIIKLIDNTDDIDKNRYISIARAQLSSSEQILLFYNCLHKNGREKFKPLIEKYTLFNNIDSNLLINDKIKNSYDKKAYDKV
ncbi:Putative phage abortive infection protein [Chishuiella changwenlii]|uniref:Putative phage abortive infection protein n=1 Tax=Chishuiella changwenlii TaxID=1434701 RepID=A0A1M6XDN2_9FLAO|nr:putative phage abortive infection protein [Chishuiella changwenlii]GGF00505.1 hypothetical protein GCM10010984_17630 [Chishuiella changwenlii]SHL04028.1 Putative phage abortive infection protein [Chishuiella changwenlii]